MKHLSALFAGSLLLLEVSAQSPYRPFPEANAGWVETHGFLENGVRWVSCTRTIRFTTDTTIAGVQYRRLRSQGDCESFYVQSMSDYEYWDEPESVFRIFRQDVDT